MRGSKRGCLKVVGVRVERLRAECPGHRGAVILPVAFNRQGILAGIFRQPPRGKRESTDRGFAALLGNATPFSGGQCPSSPPLPLATAFSDSSPPLALAPRPVAG